MKASPMGSEDRSRSGSTSAKRPASTCTPFHPRPCRVSSAMRASSSAPSIVVKRPRPFSFMPSTWYAAEMPSDVPSSRQQAGSKARTMANITLPRWGDVAATCAHLRDGAPNPDALLHLLLGTTIARGAGAEIAHADHPVGRRVSLADRRDTLEAGQLFPAPIRVACRALQRVGQLRQVRITSASQGLGGRKGAGQLSTSLEPGFEAGERVHPWVFT